MKLNTLFLLLLLPLLNISCKTEVLKENAFFNVDIDKVIINAHAYDTLIHVSTNITKWMSRSETESEWIKFERTYSGGEQYLRLLIADNPNKDIRTINVNIMGEGIDNIPFEVIQHGQDPVILADKEAISVTKEAGYTTVQISANIPVSYLLEEKADWITVKPAEKMANTNITLNYELNPALSERNTTLKIYPSGAEISLDTIYIPITQSGADIEDLLPSGDEKITILSANLTRGNVYGSQTVDKTIDNDYSTNYSGKKVNQPDSVIIDYMLADNTDIVSYAKLTQRQDQNENSIFSKGSVWYKTKGQEEWIFCSNFEVNPGDNVALDLNIKNPEQIRVCLQRSPLGNIALAEFECFKKSTDLKDIEDASIYFTDMTYSSLKSDVTIEAIKNIKSSIISSLAYDLWNGKYNNKFRSRIYYANSNPIESAKSLSIGNRSQCDNPTGIFFEANKPMIIFLDSPVKKEIALLIKDFRESKATEKITLNHGINFIKSSVDGNAYVQYWKKESEDLPSIKMHILYGNEVGFWDIRNNDTNETWSQVLELSEKLQQEKQIPNLMLDVLGEKVQLINTVNAFKTYAPNNITDIIQLHDQLLDWEYELMGLKKYNAIPNNRLLGVRSWEGSPNWNGFSANYPNSEAKMLTKDLFLSEIWVFGHEFGHANQVAQMKGGGWAEVTNNLLGAYAQYHMGDKRNLRLEHVAFTYPGSHGKIAGDRINYFLDEAYVNEVPYLQQGGNTPNEDGSFNADPFVSLVPLWQLTLFFVINENSEWYRPDFWADVHWSAINDNNPNYGYGKRYINFMKYAIEASGYNLAPFFVKMGLLKVGDRMIGDYGQPKQVKITKTMVDEVMKLGETKMSLGNTAIEYITANSLNIYKDKKAITGSENQGVSNTTGGKYISSDSWKNAVAFETYQNDKLLHISFFGTSTNDNSQTYVRFPENATHIKAVSWDGQRINVYSK